MGNVSKDQVAKILDSIRKYRDDNKSDTAIMHDLALSRASYYRYLRKIHAADKEAWLSVTRTQLENELLKLKQSYEDTYKTASAEVENATNTQDKLLASECKDNARLDIIRLLTDGPEYVKKIDDYVSEKSNIQKEAKPKREVKH